MKWRGIVMAMFVGLGQGAGVVAAPASTTGGSPAGTSPPAAQSCGGERSGADRSLWLVRRGLPRRTTRHTTYRGPPLPAP